MPLKDSIRWYNLKDFHRPDNSSIYLVPRLQNAFVTHCWLRNHKSLIVYTWLCYLFEALILSVQGKLIVYMINVSVVFTDVSSATLQVFQQPWLVALFSILPGILWLAVILLWKNENQKVLPYSLVFELIVKREMKLLVPQTIRFRYRWLHGSLVLYSGLDKVQVHIKVQWIWGWWCLQCCCAMDRPGGLLDFPVVLFLDKLIAGHRCPQRPTTRAGLKQPMITRIHNWVCKQVL